MKKKKTLKVGAAIWKLSFIDISNGGSVSTFVRVALAYCCKVAIVFYGKEDTKIGGGVWREQAKWSLLLKKNL